MVLQKDATTVLKSLSAYYTDIETSEDSETGYFIYSDISTRNDTKQRWQLNSCHAISFYLPQLLTKSPTVSLDIPGIFALFPFLLKPYGG